jgi:two-component system nitrogen regulation response regulator GlnG
MKPGDERGRILVVDDDPSIRRVYRRALGERFEVVEASSAVIALTLPDSGFSAIITDFGMPDMDGLAFVRELRARGRQAPVLLVSGDLAPARAVADWPSGIVSVLPKPFEIGALLEAVKLACVLPTASPAT